MRWIILINRMIRKNNYKKTKVNLRLENHNNNFYQCGVWAKFNQKILFMEELMSSNKI